MRLRRFPTALSEVQAAVAQTREWLDAGVGPEQIAIIAPDIEIYWPALQLYLKCEGIPANKAVFAKASTNCDVLQVLARLKLRTGQVDRAHLEAWLFATPQPPRYSDFERRFKNYYGPHQLKELIKELPPIDDQKDLCVDAFSEIIVNELSNTTSIWLEPVFQQLLGHCPSHVELPLAAWINYLERVAAKTELIFVEADSNGIEVLSLTSVDWLSSDFVMLLGMTEENLKSFEPSGLTLSEVLSIGNDLGFSLASPEQRQIEFAARWLLERPFNELHISTSASDFSGTHQAASLVWLEQSLRHNISQDLLEPSPTTRLREMQLIAPFFSDIEFMHPSKELRLSATQVENFLRCPFIFAAKKLYSLKDEPALDMDADRMASGTFEHALFEVLTTEPIDFEPSDLKLTEILDRLKTERDLGDEAFWPVLRRKYLKMARQFLQFEKEWRTLYPKSKILARELEIQAHWDLLTQQFVKSATDVKFIGRIDRVDGDDHGRVVVVDYKSSNNGLLQWNRWLEEDKLQLALYCLAVADNVTDIEASDVVAANYFVLRELERRRGFRLDEDIGLYPVGDKMKNLVNRQQKHQFFESARKHFTDVINRILVGDFRPQPKKLEHCDECRWRRLCRAPHLY